MLQFKPTLRSIIIAIIFGLGIVGVVLVWFADNVYRTLAYKSQEESIAQLVARETARISENLTELQKSLGIRLVHEDNFLEAYRQRDAEKLNYWLQQEFNRYFVTAGLLDLKALTVYDETGFPMLTVGNSESIGKKDVFCEAQRQAILGRRGSSRLKPHFIICDADKQPLSSLFITIGGLRPRGYLQVVANSVYNLKKLETILEMPLRMTTTDNAVLYESALWPSSMEDDDNLIVKYILSGTLEDSEPTIIEVAYDLTIFNNTINHNRDLVIGAAVLLISLAIVFAVIIIGRGLKPLRALQRTAEDVVRYGKLVQVDELRGYPEVITPVRSFNHMIRTIDREIKENEMARAALAQAKHLAEEHAQAMFREKEFSQVTLEAITDAVISVDKTGLVRYMNPTAEKLTGWQESKAVGQPATVVANVSDEYSGDSLAEVIDYCLLNPKEVFKLNSATLRSRNGAELTIELAASEMIDHTGKHIGIVIVLHDVTAERELSRQLTYEATHDALTGLINRHEFERRLNGLLSEQGEDSNHVLCYIDLDQFKVVNDTCGHVAGDALLRQITMLLRDLVSRRDTLARLGGDEFGLLLARCDTKHAIAITENIQEAIKEFRFVWEESTFKIGSSCGMVSFTSASGNLSSILSNADAACYMAKDAGGNRLQVYRPDDDEMQARHGEMRWVARLNQAFTEERFVLYGQSIKKTEQPREPTCYLEILVRMKDEHGNIVSPGAFLPAAERYNIAPTLDRWVIGKSFEFLAGPASDPELVLSINLSGRSLTGQGFLPFVLEKFNEYHVNPERIVFEITETAAISNLAEARAFIVEMKARGCSFALDDFGSGLSSFAYLKNLPVDILKIDGLFIRDIVHDPIDYAMVKSINEVGHVMGMKTVAEFVENDDIMRALKDIGVDYVQGYAIATPAPLENWHITPPEEHSVAG